MPAMIYVALAFALAAACLILTWYHADDQPVFGPARPGRVTFKQVLQNFFADVREVLAPAARFTRRIWVWAAPKLTNPTTWAAVTANAAIYAPLILNDPTVAPLIQALLVKYPLLGLAAALLALWATRSSSAPQRIPAPGGQFPGGGLVNNQALA